MKALLVVDAQNEFAPEGQRTVDRHDIAVARILDWVREFRSEALPIAWVLHHNKPHESKAFVPGTWGAKLSAGMGPQDGNGREQIFTKDVFGSFATPGLEEWLRRADVNELLITGFYTHMCVSTTTRQALMLGFDVSLDPEATEACALQHAVLGSQTAEEVRRYALMHLADMGAHITG